jgi:hypothetical protein
VCRIVGSLLCTVLGTGAPFLALESQNCACQSKTNNSAVLADKTRRSLRSEVMPAHD